MQKLSIIVPLYNESEGFTLLTTRLESLQKTIKNYKVELIFINDGSSDNTFELIYSYAQNNPCVSYINLSRNFGKEIAMTSAIDFCDADLAVIIDADLQDPPELIPEMIKYYEEGYDDVYAKRLSRDGETIIKKWTSKKYYQIMQSFTNVAIQKDVGDFRLLSKKCLDAIREYRELNRNMKSVFSWVGFKKKEITYHRDKRAAGNTKFNYFKLLNLAIDGFTSVTSAPLRYSAILGFFIAFCSSIYAAITLIKTLIFGISMPGYASLIIMILFLGSVQLIFIGVLGEYVGRIFTETKKRPLYHIQNSHKSDL